MRHGAGPSRLTHIGAVIWNEAAFGAGVSRSLSCLISGRWTQIGRCEDSVVEKKSSVHQTVGWLETESLAALMAAYGGLGKLFGERRPCRSLWERRARCCLERVPEEDQRTRMDNSHVEHLGRPPCVL